jgi:hypothetical protein
MTGGARMRVVLERSGGFAGRTIRRGLDTAELPDTDADALRALVAGLPADVPGARPTGATRPDGFTYAVRVDAGDRHDVHHFAEPVPEIAKPLIQLLSAAPLLPARR